MSSEVVHPPLLLELQWETPDFDTTHEPLCSLESKEIPVSKLQDIDVEVPEQAARSRTVASVRLVCCQY